MRTISDVSAEANPFPGVVVYDTFGEPGFTSVGGTSASSPIIASVYALKGNTGTLNFGSHSYAKLGALHDITKGTNGSCGGTYLCTAVKGYDGPTRQRHAEGRERVLGPKPSVSHRSGSSLSRFLLLPD